MENCIYPPSTLLGNSYLYGNISLMKTEEISAYFYVCDLNYMTL